MSATRASSSSDVEASEPVDASQPHARALGAVCDALTVAPGEGLSADEAARRLAEVGPNALDAREGPGLVQQFAAQFADVTVMALVAAAGVAVALAVLEDAPQASWVERYGDAVAIVAIVLLNAVIGFVQERKAAQALDALSALTAPEAEVLRGGRLVIVPAAEIVPGDVVTLAEGGRVPADVRLVEVHRLEVTEAALTGEAEAVRKHTTDALGGDTELAERANMAYAGTHVATGSGRGVVVATGMNTELGKIAGMLDAVEASETPLKRDLRRFGWAMVVACVVVSAVVFGVGWFRLDAPWSEQLLTSVSLAVAAIPEGLPAVTTIVLALGVQRMAARSALVRKLPAVETLGAAQVICTDKTGTLTQNRMVIRRAWVGGARWGVEGASSEAAQARWLPEDAPDAPLDIAGLSARHPVRWLLTAAQFVPAAHLDDDGEVVGNSTDGALLQLHAGFAGRLGAGPEVVETYPFDRHRRAATVLTRALGAGSGEIGDEGDSARKRVVSYTHGAAEAVLGRCASLAVEGGDDDVSGALAVAPLDDARRAELDGVMEAWASDGLRVLALACRVAPEGGVDAELGALEGDMTLLGLVGISDPPRPEVADAIAQAQRAGVRTVMITGDHPSTGAAIAREVGLLEDGASVIRGRALDDLTDAELDARVEQIGVVARATAAHKLRMIQALMRCGRVAAMTGDGVNDAPAVKAANIGVAMGRAGTDVTREAADLVLADDNYATIVAAIEEGRVIYANIKRFIVFLLAVNTGLVLAVFVGAVMGWPALLTPTQILWINLITNGTPALALGMEAKLGDPMRDPPRSTDAPLVSGREWAHLVGYGVVMALLGVGVFVAWSGPGSATDPQTLRTAQTMAFTVLSVGPLFHALNSRDLDRSLFALGLTSNPRLLGAFGLALALQAVALYMPGLGALFRTSPLGLREVGWALGLSASVWVLGELEKGARRLLRGDAAEAEADVR